MISIDKNVPIPTGQCGGRPAKYPFLDMEVGDSFLLECSADDLAKFQRRATNSANSLFGKGHITTRQEAGGVRVWRIK